MLNSARDLSAAELSMAKSQLREAQCALEELRVEMEMAREVERRAMHEREREGLSERESLEEVLHATQRELEGMQEVLAEGKLREAEAAEAIAALERERQTYDGALEEETAAREASCRCPSLVSLEM